MPCRQNEMFARHFWVGYKSGGTDVIIPLWKNTVGKLLAEEPERLGRRLWNKVASCWTWFMVASRRRRSKVGPVAAKTVDRGVVRRFRRTFFHDGGTHDLRKGGGARHLRKQCLLVVVVVVPRVPQEGKGWWCGRWCGSQKRKRVVQKEWCLGTNRTILGPIRGTVVLPAVTLGIPRAGWVGTNGIGKFEPTNFYANGMALRRSWWNLLAPQLCKWIYNKMVPSKLVGVQFMDLSKGKQPFMLARRSSKNDPSTFVCWLCFFDEFHHGIHHHENTIWYRNIYFDIFQPRNKQIQVTRGDINPRKTPKPPGRRGFPLLDFNVQHPFQQI